MNIYQVSCYSDCGSYFESYLQHVSVAAESKEQALELVKEWLQKEKHEFIKKDSKFSNVSLVQENLSTGVFDHHYDSDY